MELDIWIKTLVDMSSKVTNCLEHSYARMNIKPHVYGKDSVVRDGEEEE